MKTTILIAFLGIFSLASFAQWSFQNPRPTGNDLHTVCFTDPLNGWAAGSFSLIHTTDGGVTWDIQDPGTYLSGSVFFTDADHGWLTAYDQIIFHTSNGGETWESQSWTTGNTRESLEELFFTDNLNGWAVGGASTNGLPAADFILHTTSGGDVWEVQYIGVDIRLNGVYFADNQHGWAVGFRGKILYTSNGGQSWNVQTSGTNSVIFSDVAFADLQHGWAVGYHSGHGYVYHTSDGGNSWQLQLELQGIGFHGVCCASNSTGWISGGVINGNNGYVYMTTDGGANWDLVADDSINYLRQICCSGSEYIWSVGSIGSIMASSDGGASWSHLDQRTPYAFTEYDVASISFPDSLHGWIAGGDTVLLHTGNGGQVWSRQQTSFGKKIRSVSFPDALHGWALMDSITGQCVIRTTDGGTTWHVVYQEQSASFFDICFVSPLCGWVCGYHGIIKHTSDGGISWTTQYENQDERYEKLFFLDSLNGWAAGGSIYWTPGIILHTNDGGETWKQQYEGSEDFTSICFADMSHGWAVNYHACFKTVDGGLNWEMFSDTMLHLNMVTCSDSLHIYMAGTSGAIYHSADGGDTWTLQNSYGTQLYAIQAVDSLRVFAFGLDGVVLHTANAGMVPVAIDEPGPKEEPLYQECLIYPNPAGNQVIIDGPAGIFTRYAIITLTGQPLLQGVLPASMTVNLETLPPGIYLMRLEGEQTGRRVTLKLMKQK